jgi:hypothetical protein
VYAAIFKLGPTFEGIVDILDNYILFTQKKWIFKKYKYWKLSQKLKYCTNTFEGEVESAPITEPRNWSITVGALPGITHAKMQIQRYLIVEAYNSEIDYCRTKHKENITRLDDAYPGVQEFKPMSKDQGFMSALKYYLDGSHLIDKKLIFRPPNDAIPTYEVFTKPYFNWLL